MIKGMDNRIILEITMEVQWDCVIAEVFVGMCQVKHLGLWCPWNLKVVPKYSTLLFLDSDLGPFQTSILSSLKWGLVKILYRITEV